MDTIQETGAAKKAFRRRWLLWLAGAVPLVVAVVLLVVVGKYRYYRAHADTILRNRVVSSLSERFNSPVTLDSLHLDTSNGVHVTGTGLKILYLAGPTRPDADPTSPPPMVSVDRFEFQTDFKELLKPTSHILTVFVSGLRLDIPPHQADSPRRQHRSDPAPNSSKISLAVDKIVCTDSRLVIETSKPGKLPLIFNIASITLTDVGPNKPLNFDAAMTNPKPVGDVRVMGHFGPWQAADPRDTAINGEYNFTHADLATFKGISGMLSSTGKFAGRLGHIDVTGSTDIPDFKLDTADHAVAMHADFQAEVNGLNGDTTLKQADVRVLQSVMHASGTIFRVGVPTTGVTGHDMELQVAIDQGRIEDLLTLTTKTNPPIIRGAMVSRHRFSLPPGNLSVLKRLRLSGTFTLHDVIFGNPRMQQEIDELSMRAQGHPDAANPREAALVASSMTGEFQQADAVVSASNMQFTIPGATLKLNGRYTLEGGRMDFAGVVRTNATASQMTTGWKSTLLKAIDPLLKKNGAGLEVPITISGTKADPKFGIDMKKLFR
jgi:hypothetical protein